MVEPADRMLGSGSDRTKSEDAAVRTRPADFFSGHNEKGMGEAGADREALQIV